MKILFVCLGNICRSPLAEALLTDKLERRGFAGQFEINSCGTANYHIGEAPDPRTIRNAAKNGIAINHVGRQLSASDLKEFDMIIAMDRSNHTNILKLYNADNYAGKIFMMRQFDPAGEGKDVPDPWSGGEKEFQETFEILDRSTDGLIVFLVAKLR